jgi:hypothetical protein
MHKLHKRSQISLKTIIKMVHRTIHEDHQSHQEFMKSTSRLHEGHESYQELIKQYMEKSSWPSIFPKIYERVFNKVHQDHELYQKFRRIRENHQLHEGFWKGLWQSSVVLRVYDRKHTGDQVDYQPCFYRFLKRYEKPFSLSITSKEFMRWLCH